jgi:hypothetical protein
MRIKKTSLKIILIVFGFIFWVNGRGQNTIINEIDRNLTSEYENMMNSDVSIRCDSLEPIFMRKLSTSLLNPATIKNKFDSLSEYILIRGSDDKKVRFFSWDNGCGGTSHIIHSLVQFIEGNGDIGIKKLSPGNEINGGGYLDCSYYEVHVVSINNSKVYITFAWGTHGEGLQFDRIQAFKIVGNQFRECKSYIMNKNDLVLEYRRGKKLNLHFNVTSNEITFNEFSHNENERFPTFTGKVVTLKLNKIGFFKEQ